MSLLSIIQGAASSLNFPVPISVVGNSDPAVVQWLTLAQREGKELSKRHDWQNLIVHQTWVTAATEPQPLALPVASYDHLVPDVELWDRTSNTMLIGPTPSWVWQRIKSSGTTGGTVKRWRLIGDILNVYPAPTAGLTYALEYVDKRWCQSSASVAQSAWAADTDTARIPEHLMELGLCWRWLKAKGQAYAEEMATYEREVEKASGRDRGLRIMIVNPSRGDLVDPLWDGTIDA